MRGALGQESYMTSYYSVKLSDLHRSQLTCGTFKYPVRTAQ